MYPYLVHADWFGFTLADLVFPSFLFAVGNSMSFSMQNLNQAEAGLFWRKVLRRTFIIFLLGFLMYWYPFFRTNAEGSLELMPFGETRVLGVLQRIALCYFFAAVLIRYCSEKMLWIISGIILLAYWGILYLFGEPGQELDIANGVATKLDLAVLGLGHIYKNDVVPFDPEGILSTLPAIVNVIGGYLAGIYILRKGKTFETLSLLLITGFMLTALALWWDLIFPIAKKLWTSPFALYTIGLDLSILAILVYAVEIRNLRFGTTFFNVFGKNPLIIYLFSEILYITMRLIHTASGLDLYEWVSERVFQAIFPGSFGAFMTAVVFMLTCWLLGWWLYKRKIYIKI